MSTKALKRKGPVGEIGTKCSTFNLHRYRQTSPATWMDRLSLLGQKTRSMNDI
jgi:hypothetical protein